jgi:hypothetical protein
VPVGVPPFFEVVTMALQFTVFPGFTLLGVHETWVVVGYTSTVDVAVLVEVLTLVTVEVSVCVVLEVSVVGTVVVLTLVRVVV